MATNTHHYIIIPNGDKDVMALFVCYDYMGTFPKILATNGRNCQVYSHPLYAHATGLHHSPYSPKEELLFNSNTQYTDLVNWAITNEDDHMLKPHILPDVSEP